MAFFGPNGSGKTTLLEGISVLTSGSSFRASQAVDWVRIGQEKAEIELRTTEGDVRRVVIEHGRRRFFRDGKGTTLEKFIRGSSVVVLAPEHRSLFSGHRDERLRWIDGMATALEPAFLTILRGYRRALTHKQALLRNELSWSSYNEQVGAWDETLAELGLQMRQRREEVMRDFEPRFRREHESVTQDRAEVSVVYVASDVPLREELCQRRRAEHAAGRTFCGAHRDDIHFTIHSLRASLGSQGEVSTLLLAIKLAEVELLQTREALPRLLLDDVGITLDEERRKRLFNRLQTIVVPVYVTTADIAIARAVSSIEGQVMQRSEEKEILGFSIARWIPA